MSYENIMKIKVNSQAIDIEKNYKIRLKIMAFAEDYKKNRFGYVN